jgi:hypothetical protein
MSIWGPPPAKPCENPRCKRLFQPAAWNSKYCSHACLTSAYRQRRRLVGIFEPSGDGPQVYGPPPAPDVIQPPPTLKQAIHDAFVTHAIHNPPPSGPTLAEADAALRAIIGNKEFVDYPNDIVASRPQDKPDESKR